MNSVCIKCEGKEMILVYSFSAITVVMFFFVNAEDGSNGCG